MQDKIAGDHRGPRPLDAAGLDALALSYAARFATTEVRLARYLTRKLRERGWCGGAPPDVAALVARVAALGYVDDAAYAAMKGRDLTARGFGAGRVAGALRAAGIAGALASSVTADVDPLGAAIAFARRRRLGPFATTVRGDPQVAARRALAAMLRAGHAPAVARLVLAASDVEALTGD